MLTRLMTLIMVQCVLFSAGGSVGAQQQQQQRDEQSPLRPGRGLAGTETPPPEASIAPERSLRSFHLSNVKPEQVVRVLQLLYPDIHVIAVLPIESVLCLCDSEEQAAVAEVIELLDVPEEDYPPIEFTVLPVRHRSAQEMVARLEPLTSLHMANVNADEARSSLVVRSSSKANLQEVEKLLQALDTPSRAVQLEFAVFLTDLNSSDSTKEMPNDLGEVAKELARFGYVKLLGRYHTVASEGQDFFVRGSIHRILDADIKGKVAAAEKDAPVRVSISARVQFREIIPATPTSSETIAHGSFDISTSLALKPDEFVAIGTSAAGLSEGQSLILVARVRP